MKKILDLALIFICSYSLLFAKNNNGGSAAREITVETVSRVISQGQQTGLKVDIFQASKKDVTKEWSKHIRQNTKSKVEEFDNEIVIIGTNISEITNAPLNIYAVINDYLDHIEVNAFFETPDGFITKENAETEFLSCRKFLRDFGVIIYRDAVKEELKKEEKDLKELHSDLNKIVDSNDKLHKNIAKEERDIIEARNDIKSNDLDQDRLRNEIQSAKSRIYNIKGSEARKEAEKALSELEKDLSKLKKDNEDYHKEIVKSEADIRSYTREIDDNTILMLRKEKDIDRQMDIIYRVEQKLSAIR